MSYALANLASAPPQVAQQGWHGPDDIQSLLGIIGTFYWPENPFRPAMMNFIFSAEGFGYYTLSTLGGMTLEEGYWVPSGEPPGAAGLMLTPSSGGLVRHYEVRGIFTDANWKIYVLLLRGPNSLFFLPFRIA